MRQVRRKLGKEWSKNKQVYLMLLPVLTYYIVFHYAPMYGAIIAFKDFSPADGILRSPWVGFMWFKEFFSSFYFSRLIRNTVLLNVYGILFGFPVPILFALLLNELTDGAFKRVVQTVTYLPHFISTVVVVGMLVSFTARDGLLNDIVAFFGGQRTSFLMEPGWFRTLFVGSGIWQEFGWGSIVYLAAIAGIDPTLYEAAVIDGASRWKQMWHVTIPGIMPVIVIMFILRVGRVMNVGFEKVLLMYNPMIYETADVISTFVYRKGLLEMNYSYSTAIGLFNSVINFALLVGVNRISRRLNETSLW
jgi:putative aldouronate transport system permease protein